MFSIPESFRRRALGFVLLLLAVALILWMLPAPRSAPELPAGIQRVTLDLRPAPADAVPESPPEPAKPLTPTPPVIAQPAPQLKLAAELESLEAPDAIAQADPVKPAAEPDLAPGVPVSRRPTPANPIGGKPAPQPASKSAPVAAEPPPVSKAPAPALPLPKPVPKGWQVQLGSFNDIANARQAVDLAKNAGLSAFIVPVESAKGTAYRVRLGPFAERVQADAARDQAKKSGYPDAGLVSP